MLSVYVVSNKSNKNPLGANSIIPTNFHPGPWTFSSKLLFKCESNHDKGCMTPLNNVSKNFQQPAENSADWFLVPTVAVQKSTK